MNDIEIVTVYADKEAKTYLLSDYIANGDKATVLKHVGYNKPPVIKFEYVESLPNTESK